MRIGRFSKIFSEIFSSSFLVACLLCVPKLMIPVSAMDLIGHETGHLGRGCKVGFGRRLQLDLGGDLDLVLLSADNTDRPIRGTGDGHRTAGSKIETVGFCDRAFMSLRAAGAKAQRTRQQNGENQILVFSFLKEGEPSNDNLTLYASGSSRSTGFIVGGKRSCRADW